MPPEKDKMWANIKDFKSGSSRKREAIIHIHNIDDIQGGQWREPVPKSQDRTGRVSKIN